MSVIVVGAGPTGLTLAGDLAAAGVPTTVVERRVDESNLTRAFGVHARTLELLDARGLADELLPTGARVGRLRVFDSIGLDLGAMPSRFPYLLITPQYNVERVLRTRVAGVTFVAGTVVGVEQDGAGASVVLSSGERLTASYVVGADGSRSAVRTAIGQPFPGTSVIESLMLADIRLAEPPDEVLTVNGVGDCFAFVAPFGDGWYRIFAWDRTNPQPESAPLTLDEVRAVAVRALGTDFGMHSPRWLSRFHSDERQVPSYRVGRVFLAGDAAHVHSPAGGQGMNTGIQDAANLSWKLAAVLAGNSPADLLDTYQSERHPVGRMVLRTSGAIIRAAMVRSRPGRAARNALVGSMLRIGPVARRATGSVSGVGISYPAPRGSHRLVGQRASDVALVGGSRLYEALRAGTFVLLAPASVAEAVAPRSGRVAVVVPAAGASPLSGASTTVLVRPDGYVAWASSTLDSAGVVAALERHCGAPVVSS